MPRSIVVGLDGSEASARAAECAAAEARHSKLDLVVACVIPWSQYSFTTPEDNERRSIDRQQEIKMAQEKVIDPVVARLGGDGLSIAQEIQHGHPAETLVRMARQHDASRIVVGRTGQSKVRTMLFGSTPSNLIQISPLPVLVVP